MKLHFYDDSIENAACGVKSDNTTDNGHDVTCTKCRKIVAKFSKEMAAIYAKEEAAAKFYRGYEV